MTLISFSPIQDGVTGVDAAATNTPLNTIYNDYNGNITDANISATAAIATSKLALSAAWSSWTPTWTNLTIGNSTQVAKYLQVGKTVFFELSIVQGSTGSVGSAPNFSLPVNVSANYITGSPNGGYIGDNALLNASTAVYNGRNRILTTSTLQLEYFSVSGANVIQSDVSASAPFTFATGSKLFVWGTYESV